MLVLSLDLSLNCTGYSVLCCEDGAISVVEKGIINNKRVPTNELGKKLCNIKNEVARLLRTYKIDSVCREASFSNSRITATQRLFMVVGVVYQVCAEFGYSVYEYAPTTVKKQIGGSGKADKSVVKDNLINYVDIKEYKTEDESDAVAVGITHLLSMNIPVCLRCVAEN